MWNVRPIVPPFSGPATVRRKENAVCAITRRGRPRAHRRPRRPGQRGRFVLRPLQEGEPVQPEGAAGSLPAKLLGDRGGDGRAGLQVLQGVRGRWGSPDHVFTHRQRL